MYSLILNPVIIDQVIQETNIRRTRMIRKRRNWYQLHVGTQGGSARLSNDHQSIFKVKLKDKYISSFVSIYLQYQYRIIGT